MACSIVVHGCVHLISSLGIFGASSGDLGVMVVSSRDTRVESLLDHKRMSRRVSRIAGAIPFRLIASWLESGFRVFVVSESWKILEPVASS